jgi:exosortase
MIFAPVFLVAILCFSTLRELHGLWTDTESRAMTHGYLIAVVSLLLIWRAAGHVRRADLRFTPAAMLAFGAVAMAWLVMALAGFRLVEILLLPILIGTAIWASFGSEIARRCGFAVAYLWFATPALHFLTLPLQWVTVYVVRVMLRATGVPAYFDENFVRVPAGTFEIEGGCSGIHFFVVATALAALLGELRQDSLRRRLWLIVAAALVSALANWIRVFAIILAGHASDMQHYLVTRSHYGFGWVLFAVSMLLFFLIERRLPEDGPGRPQTRPIQDSAIGMRSVAGLALLAVTVAVLTVWRLLSLRPGTEPWQFAVSPPGWREIESPSDLWAPRFVGVDETRAGRWIDMEGLQVDRFQGLYRNQRQDKEISGYHNELRGDVASGEWRVSMRYRIDGHVFRSAYPAQLAYAVLSLVSLHAPLSEVDAIRAGCGSDCDKADRAVSEWENRGS